MRTLETCVLALSLSSPLVYALAAEDLRSCAQSLNLLSETEDVLVSDSGINLRGRVDTGAEQSSLHAFDLKIIEKNNEQYVQFNSLDDAGMPHEMKEKLQYTTEVTNTSGIPEKRYVIKTKVIIKNKEFILDVKLKNRSRMQYKFLIGRDLLKQGGFTVDVSA